jgi:hypothetical protein
VETGKRVLIIVPSGRAKIWDKHPSHGAAPAQEAYTGAPFGLNRSYAEQFGDAWVILSAKYGFVPPESPIPGPYEVTFKRPATGSVTIDQLREQIYDLSLDDFPVVVGLGGKEYRAAIGRAFAGLPARVFFPFAGLPIGRSMQATKRAIQSGDPGFTPEVKSGG